MAFLLAPAGRTLAVTHEIGIIPSLAPKDADAVLQYVWAWGEWLDAEETEIETFEVEIDDGPDLLLEQSEAATSDAVEGDEEVPAESARNVCAWFAAGTRDRDYLVRCRVVTTSGLTEDRSFWLPVRRL